ncbi:MAG: acyl-ACP--UDP-N-acetylglucosamine O-acyltransferase [Nitrospirae bacterium]|nr:acyl-ACP--UDP-N-acetylglucosamine O-acyltransferase [Nitrospirota bacterium]
MKIHATAVVHSNASLAKGIEIGPFAVIGENVRLHPGVVIGAHSVVDGWTEIGEACRVFPFCSIGLPPQDLKYGGEPTRVRIGPRNVIREFCTIHLGTVKGGGETVIGSDNFLMAYVHIAHDCRIGNHIIMANAATLAGHISVDDHVILGGLTGVHQFVQIGAYAMVGACSAVSQDVPPFVSAVGNRARRYGLNMVGLRRHGFGPERLRALKKAYHTIFRSGLSLMDAVKKVQEELSESPDVRQLVEFVLRKSKRGLCR